MVLIFAPKTTDVIKIRKIGSTVIESKKIFFLNFKFILNLNFLMINDKIIRIGVRTTICLVIKIIGFIIWFRTSYSLCRLDLFNPYKTVIKSFCNNQKRWGDNNNNIIDSEIKKLGKYFLFFLKPKNKKIKIEINK